MINHQTTVPITYETVMPIWRAELWRFCAYLLIFATAISTLAALFGVLEHTANGYRMFGVRSYVWGILGFAPIGIAAVKGALSKKYHGYCVRLVKPPNAEQFAINPTDAASIWWSMTWRAMSVNLIIGWLDVLFANALGVSALGSPVAVIALSLILYLWALKAALLKEHSGCSVELVAHESNQVDEQN